MWNAWPHTSGPPNKNMIPLTLLLTCWPRFLNRDDLDFAAVEQLAPVQEWDLQREDPQGVLEYPTQ